MKFISRVIVEFLVIAVLYHIICMLWVMAEVKLYGYSQTSVIDSMAAVALAAGSAEVLTHGMWR